MVFSYTGIAYLILSFATGFLTYRFFQYWQKAQDRISKLFFLFIVPLFLFTLFTAIICLFFADNILLLNLVVLVSLIMQAIACGVLFYIFIYLKFPKISPWFGFFSIFALGILAVIITPFTNPILDSARSMVWNINFALHYIILRGLIVLPIAGIAIIFVEQYKSSTDPIIRSRASGLAILFLAGLGIALFDFLAGEAFIRDLGYMALSLSAILTLIITQKSPN